ncbi:Aste57867_11022 [Aphanomyces stellatus]|uniref:Aste57867_11022 protein n=1 Tax=Aphanomyces stellatus TaxID=120398 RepID=A0A485KRV9_9STRA|nr:hypothetical protein As57867_010981 [Aphanomyces stellatus]VFT87890.1 Aste57867_11022 [Aphanomyces stellatus]
MQHTPLVLCLPADVLLNIVSFVADATTLFAWLDALGTAASRGPLEPLWQLGRLQAPTTLWPSLRLQKTTMENAAARVNVEAIVRYFVNSPVQVGWPDALEWLLRHVRPWITVYWNARLPLATVRRAPHDWFSSWAELPLVHVTLTDLSPSDAVVSTAFYAALPRCTGLTRLDLAGHLDLRAIFHFAATSTKLQALYLSCSGGGHSQVTTGVLADACHWLACTRVTMFQFGAWVWADDVDNAARAAFYAALFSHKTMETIALWQCSLPNLELTTPLGVRKLVLVECSLSPRSVRGLAHAVPHSALAELAMDDLVRNSPHSGAYLDAFAWLMQALCHSNVATLSLERCNLGDMYWPRLAPLLQQIPTLESVNLKGNDIRDTRSAGLLAHAIAAHANLRKVDLFNNCLDTEGAIALLKCNAGRRSTHPVQEICLRGYCTDRDDEIWILRPLAKAQGFSRFNNEPLTD